MRLFLFLTFTLIAACGSTSKDTRVSEGSPAAKGALAATTGTIEATEIYDGDMATVTVYGETAGLLFKLISEKKADNGMACGLNNNQAETKSKSKYKCWFLVSKGGEVSSPGTK